MGENNFKINFKALFVMLWKEWLVDDVEEYVRVKMAQKVASMGWKIICLLLKILSLISLISFLVQFIKINFCSLFH